jgi:hypothetical protein
MSINIKTVFVSFENVFGVKLFVNIFTLKEKRKRKKREQKIITKRAVTFTIFVNVM